jgi:macrolide-specific efflux system membrane fusion protein
MMSPVFKKWKSLSKRHRVLVSAAAFFLLVLFVWFFRRNPGGISYNEVSIKRGNIQVTIIATGYVSPENRLEIKPPIAGRVERVLIEEGQVVKKGQILAWMSSTERAALLDSARAQGPDEIKKWEELYKPTPIIAPIDGTIILKSVESGQTFSNSEAILVMSDRLTVKALVDETDIAQIKLKQRAEINLDAYPEAKILGSVDQISFEARTINSVTTYLTDVLPDQTPEFMRAGMTANVTFSIDSKQNVLLIPNEALKMRNGKTIATVPSATGPEEKEISLGVSDGKQSEVLNGLHENDTILIRQINAETPSSGLFAPMRGPRGR